MKIVVNEQSHELPVGTTVSALLTVLGLAERKGIALALNEAVLPRAQWSARVLTEGEKVLVIQATQGG